MIDAIHFHHATDKDTGMTLRSPYAHLMTTLGELDGFAEHIQRLTPEILNKGHIMNVLRERLRLLGFAGKISHELPNFLFTFGKVFSNVATFESENPQHQQTTSASIVFARGSDENWEYTSSLLAALAVTNNQPVPDQPSPNDRFTLAFMTRQVPLDLDKALIYPFPQSLPRQVIHGNILYTGDEVTTQIDNASPSARDHLLAIMELPSRRKRKQISLSDATATFLTHFFIHTPEESPYFPHFYQPVDFVREGRIAQ